jgi:hypothetical protein
MSSACGLLRRSRQPRSRRHIFDAAHGVSNETLELPGSHVVFLVHPKEVTALIEKAAQTAN